MNAEQVAIQILDSVLDDVQLHAEEELAEVKKEFLTRLAQQREELLKEAETRLSLLQAELQLADEASKLKLELQMKEKRFEVVDSIVSEVIEGCKEKFHTIRGTPVYEDALKRYVVKALEYTAETDIVIEGNVEDKPLLRRIANALGNERNMNIVVSDEDIDTLGGLVVRTQDGSFTYLSTVEVRVSELQEDLRKMILEKLTAE